MNGGLIDFSKAFNSLDCLMPLHDDLLSLFYIDRPGNPFPEMLLTLRTSDRGAKVLFSGCRGSGKTTELMRLCAAVQDQFFVVFFDTVTSVDFVTIDHVQLLLALTLQVYEAATQQRVKLPRQIAEELYDLVSIAGIAEEKSRDAQVDIGAELNVQLARLTGTLGLGAGTAKTITRQLEPRLGETLGKLNNLIEEVAKKRNKRMLIIVDGLDRAPLQVQRDLFLRFGEALYSPECHIVYVVAPTLLHEPDTSAINYAVSAHYRLPNFQVVKRNASPDMIGRRLLKEVITRRVGESLFSKRALDDIVAHSGGLVRDLVHLARHALVGAEIEEARQVGRTHAKEAIRHQAASFARALSQDHLDLLASMGTTGILPRTEITKFLIETHIILQLEDDLGPWYVVHPCLATVMEQHLAARTASETPSA